MGLVELLLVAVGLSMDAFAVAIAKGLKMPRVNYRHAAVIALFFGAFQAAMPLLGWLLGSRFRQGIEAFDHWIAFTLLAFIGGKMIYEALRGNGDDTQSDAYALDLKELTILAVATSIDALAVGITFALLPETNIWLSITLIGCTTFLLSFAGVAVGNRFGMRYRKRAELFGGGVLIFIGLKILLEHLGLVAF